MLGHLNVSISCLCISTSINLKFQKSHTMLGSIFTITLEWYKICVLGGTPFDANTLNKLHIPQWSSGLHAFLAPRKLRFNARSRVHNDLEDHYISSPMSLDPQWHVKEPWRHLL